MTWLASHTLNTGLLSNHNSKVVNKAILTHGMITVKHVCQLHKQQPRYYMGLPRLFTDQLKCSVGLHRVRLQRFAHFVVSTDGT